jgi:hypothetical protein
LAWNIEVFQKSFVQAPVIIPTLSESTSDGSGLNEANIKTSIEIG